VGEIIKNLFNFWCKGFTKGNILVKIGVQVVKSGGK
jgi:hypothetical protein